MRRYATALSALVLAATMGWANTAWGVTEAQKDAAIDKALEWLAQNQQPSGGWTYDFSYGDIAATGAAVLSFLDQGYAAGNPVIFGANNYGDVVGDGLTYLFNQASIVPIGVQPAGNPDSNGNGIGVKFVPGPANGRDTYVTGLVLPAIAATGTPLAVVGSGPLAGMTYKQVVQEAVDYFAWGQNDAGYAQGGWRYYANSGDADNSTAQWPAIGMLFAQRMGVTPPQFVKDELAVWINYIQNPVSGGSGYDNPWNIVNEAKTGGLLAEMLLAGDDTALVPYNLSHPKVIAALNYLNATWLNGPNNTWDGNFLHPYAMWSIYKGLESMIGLDNTTAITNLHAPGLMDPGDVWNWWEDYCHALVNNQNPDGSWTGYSNWPAVLATPWYVNILNATEIAPPPPPPPGGPIPEPASAALALLALAGIGGASLRRRRRV